MKEKETDFLLLRSCDEGGQKVRWCSWEHIGSHGKSWPWQKYAWCNCPTPIHQHSHEPLQAHVVRLAKPKGAGLLAIIQFLSMFHCPLSSKNSQLVLYSSLSTPWRHRPSRYSICRHNISLSQSLPYYSTLQPAHTKITIFPILRCLTGDRLVLQFW